MKPRSKEIQPGERGAWNTSQGRTTGRVEKKITRPTKIKAHPVSASKENPEYLVRSEKSGRRAAHKAAALKKL